MCSNIGHNALNTLWEASKWCFEAILTKLRNQNFRHFSLFFVVFHGCSGSLRPARRRLQRPKMLKKVPHQGRHFSTTGDFFEGKKIIFIFSERIRRGVRTCIQRGDTDTRGDPNTQPKLAQIHTNSPKASNSILKHTHTRQRFQAINTLCVSGLPSLCSSTSECLAIYLQCI